MAPLLGGGKRKRSRSLPSRRIGKSSDNKRFAYLRKVQRGGQGVGGIGPVVRGRKNALSATPKSMERQNAQRRNEGLVQGAKRR